MRISIYTLSILFIFQAYAVSLSAQTTEFTYQGSLKNAASAATGNFDFEFQLFDASTGGTQIGSTITTNTVAVVSGAFAVKLDFGSAFPGANRFLEIHVRQTGGGAFTPLTPRQAVSSSPYSVKSLNADNAATANNATQLGGVAANQYVLTGDVRLSDARPPTAGSVNYIQNSISQQANSNFGVSGDGFINGSGGVGTTTNTFIGSPARFTVVQKTSGQWAQHIGTNNFAPGNSFGLLIDAGTNGLDRALTVRSQSGTPDIFSIRGDGNVGIGTGNPNTSLHLKTDSTTGFAIQMENTSTAKRLYIGNYGTTGGGNHWPGLDSANTSFLFAENSLVFTTPGGIYFSGSTAVEHMRISPSGNVGIGTTNPNFKFEVNSTQNNQFAGLIRNVGSPTDASFGLLVRAGTSANDTAFETDDIGGNTLLRVKGNGFTGIGVTNPTYRLHVVEPTPFTYAGFISGYDGLRLSGTNTALYATAGGSSLLVGAGPGRVQVLGGFNTDSLTTTGNASIAGTETVQGDAVFNGRLTLNNQPNGGVPICYAYSANFITQCASSRRFKKNISDFSRGLDLIRSLRPVTFDWKSDDRPDIGLIAEEVETIEPLLTTHLQDGQIQGVRYDLIGVALINAVKEQQAQIEAQKAEIEALKAVICEIKPTAAVCKK